MDKDSLQLAPVPARGDLLQELLGWGRLPSGTNLIVGPVQLQVPRERAKEARELLAATADTMVESDLDESADE